MKFRPCIDLRNGKVVQIVGSTLSDHNEANIETNFTTDREAADFARLYQHDQLLGGHVIALGEGNREAALSALGAFPGGMHYGGGVNAENASDYLEAGASHVIVTSYVFAGGRIDHDRLNRMVKAIGKQRLVLDLSCRWRDGAFWVVTDRWQIFTNEAVTPALLTSLSCHCDEFLVHGVDVEGKMQGLQEQLITLLGEYSPLPVTYAGGASKLDDLDAVRQLGGGRVDLTIGSALDIFGGSIAYRDVVAWHHQHQV
jgi:phosphoribosylformimino-5-aminoimidazole carboxamide ribotide isomerase